MFLRIPLFAAFLFAVLSGTARALPQITYSVAPYIPEGHPTATYAPDGTFILIQLTLSEPAPAGCSFRFVERPGSEARRNVDYEIRLGEQIQLTPQANDRFVITEGVQAANFVARCIGDWIGEPDKLLAASFAEPANCTFPSPDWSTTIADDDRALFVTCSPVSPTRVSIYVFSDASFQGPNFYALATMTRDGLYGASPSVALADVFDNDGVPEVIVGSDAGAATRFYVYRWHGNPGIGETTEYFPYGQSDAQGCFVAGGDCGGIGGAEEVVTGTRGAQTGQAKCQVWARQFQGAGANTLHLAAEAPPVFAYFDPAVVPALADMDGDGIGDMVTGNGPGGNMVNGVLGKFGTYGPNYAFNNTAPVGFTPYPGNKDGLSVSAGDWNGDGRADFVTGAGPNSGSHVIVYDPWRQENIYGFFLPSPNFTGGARVAMTPRRSYSPSGGWRTLLLAGSHTGAHPGAVHFSDGTAPLQIPINIMSTPRTAIAAWTPRQQFETGPVKMELVSAVPQPGPPFYVKKCSLRMSNMPPGTFWRLEFSQDLNTWYPETRYQSTPPGPSGVTYFSELYQEFQGERFFWRLRRL